MNIIFKYIVAVIILSNQVSCDGAPSMNSRENFVSQESFDDFKSLMMYFNEPLLSKASIENIYIGKKKGDSFEGANGSVMAMKLCGTIRSLHETSNFEVIKFGEYLSDGTEFLLNFPEKFNEDLLSRAQNELVDKLTSKRKIVLPFGWIGNRGHSIGLVIELNANNTYNLIVINTGDGLQYHAQISDPNGVYHSLPRMWIEFKNIPKEEIFSENAWLMYVFYAFNSSESVKKIESVAKSVPHYFYGSILSNFVKYAHEPDLSHKKLLPAQRSGSCTISSLMASYFYLEKDDVTFHKTRVIIGHQMLEDFIGKYENSPDFEKLITDGFDVIGRNLWRSTSSALAYQMFSYLEHRFPKSFKNAGLIGADRRNWIKLRKDQAIKDLNGSPDDLKLMKKCIELASKIKEILAKHSINPDSRKIQTNSLVSKLKNCVYWSNVYKTWKNSKKQLNLFSIFSKTIERDRTKIQGFYLLYERLTNCKNILQNSIFSCVRDTFESVDRQDWWTYLENNTAQSILGFLKLCTSIIKVITKSMCLPNALDDIVTLAHLQIAIWKSAVEYDKTIRNQKLKLGLENISPPPILEDLIQNFMPLMTSGQFKNWPIITVFSPNNIDKLKFLLTSYANITTGNETFLGPSNFLSHQETKCDTSALYSIIERNNSSSKMYEKMFKLKKIKSKIDDIRKLHLNLNDPNDSDWLTCEYVQLTIFLTIFDHVSIYFPHYTNLIDGMIWIYKRAANEPFSVNIRTDNSFTFIESKNLVTMSYNEIILYKNNYNLYNENDEHPLSLVTAGTTLKMNKIGVLFYKLRHSQAKGYPENIINLESWLNYVKGSNDSTIFEDPHFAYLSNHIMNMPRLTLDSRGEVQDDKMELYPEGFEQKHVKEIFENFIRLINKDLNLLIEKRGQLSNEISKKLVKRAVNIAITLVRFIIRIDYDQMVTANSCSQMLSHVYKAFFKFGFLKNEFDLDEEQISSVNLVLTQICDAPIKNPETFLNMISHLFPDGNEVRFRKSLARVHWYICKSHYYPFAPGKSHADDLFVNGFVFHKVAYNEIENLESLINFLIIPKHVENPQSIIYKFSDDGNMVVIEIKSHDFIDTVSLCLQLSSGRSIKNSYQVVDKSIIVNNSKFKSYFSAEFDRKYAIRGEFTKIGTVLMYIADDYQQRGNTIVFLCESDNCTVYRKYSENWYEWIDDKTLIGNLKRATNYYWIDDHKVYQRKINENGYEIIAIKDQDSEPLFRINGLNGQDIKFNLGAFAFDWKLLKSGSELEDTELEKHLRKFTDTDTILAKQLHCDSLVVIYPGLRFKEDPKHPVVLVETGPDLNEFQVFNVPGLIVETDQNAVNNGGIPGTLVVISKDGQRFILAPITPTESKPEVIDRTLLRYIEKIPIVQGVPAPQTRLQRLLLAFYSVKARLYSFALELLHPFTSIDQNENLVKAELKIIEWIALIEGGGPEAAALKLMATYHALINAEKFPLEYVEEKTNLDTLEAKAKKLRSLTLSIIKTSITRTARIYFGSIRDLSEKYYLHRIFPEFINSTMVTSCFKSIFIPSSQPEIIESESINSTFSIPNSAPYDLKYKDLNFERIEGSDVEIILNYMSSEQQKNNLDEYLKLKSKLLHRNKDKGTESTFSDREIFVLCASFDKSLYKNAAYLYKIYKNESIQFRNDQFKRTVKLSQITESMSEASKRCLSKYRNTKLKRLNVTSRSTFTEFDVMIENLKADTKPQVSSVKSFNFESFKPVQVNEIEEFHTVSREIRSILIPEKGQIKTNFTHSNLEQSHVLSKLEFSIAAFIREKGQFSVSELELLGSTISLINRFKDILAERTRNLTVNMKDLTVNLSYAILSNDLNNSISHTIESLNRFMHQRKSKLFPNLYSCYQKESVDCIQNKFPQLSIEECADVLNSTMKFYSYQVLLDYYNMLLDSIAKLLTPKLVSVDDLLIFLDELEKINDFNDRIKIPSILNFEYRSRKYRLRSEQVKDIENFTSKDEHSGLYKSSVIQRIMAAGKTLVLGTISVVQKALDSSKLSILVPPSSLYQSNLSATQAITYTYFKTPGHNFIFPRFQFGSNNDLTNVVIPFLETILRSIECVKKAHDYYVLSPDSLHSFINSYIEMINYQVEKCKFDSNNCKDGFTVKALSLHAKIYNIFRTQGSIIFDEIDMTMDPKKELNFPTIENEPFNMLAATLSTDLIEHSINDDNIIKNISLDILGNNQSALSAKQYDEYREALLNYIEDQLNSPDSLWSESLLDAEVPDLQRDKIIEFLRNSDMEYMRDWIQNIHKREKSLIANALVIVKAQIWRNFKDAFKGTANLNYGSAGSNRPRTDYSIPYLAANTPSPSSEFADRWETLNKTLLTLASVSCPERIAKQMIKYIRKRIAEETSLKIKIEETAMYKNVTTFIPGVDVMKLNENDPIDVGIIHGALKTRSPIAIRLLFSYALDEIFSEMKFPVEQITSNALNMVSMFGSVQGYSGTIDNVNILPRQVVTGAYENHLINEKNNGGIALKLIKDSKRSDGKARNVYQISDNDIKKPVEEMIQIIINCALNSEEERNSLSALIDTGAFFKNYKNRQISDAILDILKDRIDVVLYYDEDSNQVEFIKCIGGRSNNETGFISSTDPESIFKATQTDINKRFTFYDQRHITGSDILQPKTAIALMTVGTRVLLRDILQGTLRMRQFMTSQKVYLVTSTSAVKFYYSKVSHYLEDEAPEVTVTDLITLGAFNEDEKQLSENEKLAFIKIDNEVRRFVLEEMTRVILLADETKNLNLLKILLIWFDVKKADDSSKSVRDLFIRSIKENPLGWMFKFEKKKSALVLKDYSNHWLQELFENKQKIDNLTRINSLNSSKRFQELERVLSVMTEPTPDFSNSKESLLEFLQPEITERKCDQAAGGEVEMQVFTQQLAEIDLEKMIQTIDGNATPSVRKTFKLKKLCQDIYGHNLKDNLNDNYVSLNSVLFDDYFSGDYKNMARSALITQGKRIGVSYDLVKLIDNYPIKPYRIFSQYTWEGSHILVQVLPGNKGIRAILLSVESANDARNEMMKFNFKSQGSKFWLCDLSGSISYANDHESTNLMNVLDFIPASRELFFDILVFNGSFDHITTSKYMKEILMNKWFKTANFQYCAMFLLLRMKVLAEKSDHIFPGDFFFLSVLNRAARGDKEILSGLDKSSGAYKKAPISSEIEAKFFIENSIPRPNLVIKGESCEIDFKKTYFEITRLLAGDAGSVEIKFVDQLQPGTEIELELNDNNDTDDLLIKINPKAALEVISDPSDINTLEIFNAKTHFITKIKSELIAARIILLIILVIIIRLINET